ncbi:4-(cytidine 5'-diphospho)-2-C-methyl-D-erythritol kinase [Marinicella rhabdoformis]|uniref:4-(cytidine 5'-diphospho)-2-C-methyl-D-erythritol kinase n=1 Tax=Marinicella rhabdoformis TaxID=2580566 RepID=UPI0012AED9DF|nr:4-(cytidine 5'-diphospho)-2-C-methyl-D-erythritol kinase [Marinicella rhabdoformis]
MESITTISPAKINLMLRVLNQRGDGYHELQTVFKLLDWGDQMIFTFNDLDGDSKVSITGFKNLLLENNLIYQASELLRPFIQTPFNVAIDVKKSIPQGGGLGGGSSNAATTLTILNAHWGCQLSQEELMAMALKLGADVPFFVFAHDALATGVGENLSPIDLPVKHVLLLFPDCTVTTGDVFKDSKLKRNQLAVSEKLVLNESSWINDCLPVVLSNYPKIKKVYDGASVDYKVYLSGTGSTLFILFDDISQAEKAKKMAQAICKCHLINAKK